MKQFTYVEYLYLFMLLMTLSAIVLNTYYLRRKALSPSQRTMLWILVSSVAQLIRCVLLMISLYGWPAWVGACLGHLSVVCVFGYILQLASNVFQVAFVAARKPVPTWFNTAARVTVGLTAVNVVCWQTACAVTRTSKFEAFNMIVLVVLGAVAVATVNVVGCRLMWTVRHHNSVNTVGSTTQISLTKFKREMFANNVALISLLVLGMVSARRYYRHPLPLPYPADLPPTYFLPSCGVWLLVNCITTFAVWLFPQCTSAGLKAGRTASDSKIRSSPNNSRFVSSQKSPDRSRLAALPSAADIGEVGASSTTDIRGSPTVQAGVSAEVALRRMSHRRSTLGRTSLSIGRRGTDHSRVRDGRRSASGSPKYSPRASRTASHG